MTLPITLEPYTSKDEGFVYSSWLNSYQVTYLGTFEINKCHLPSSIHKSEKLYYQSHRSVIHKILEHKDTKVILIKNSDDNDQVVGFVCYSKDDNNTTTLHYIYIKNPFRRMGIATTVLNAIGLDRLSCSHSTYAFLKMKIDFIYKPYFLKGGS